MRKRCTTKKIPAKSAAKITYGGKLSEGCVIVNDAGKVKNAGNVNVNLNVNVDAGKVNVHLNVNVDAGNVTVLRGRLYYHTL